ncbi:MAG: ester cyclase, partial [Acidimicrobiales bacterium]
ATDFRLHGGVPNTPANLEGLKIAHGMATLTFPDIAVEVLEAVSAGDKVFLRSRGSGKTTTGARFWPEEELPAPKEFHFEAWSVYRIEKGKVAEAWDLNEVTLGMLQVRLQLLRALVESLPHLVVPGP